MENSCEISASDRKLRTSKASKTRMNDSSKVALITGASKGIGRAIGESLAEIGYNLALIARTEPLLQEVNIYFDNSYEN